jgi:hypothetical protein
MLWMGNLFEKCPRREPVKAVRVTVDQDRTLNIAPLPLPAARRTGEASAERYRQQAKGQLPRGNSFNPVPSDFLRAIVLSDGKFQGGSRVNQDRC